MVDYILRSIICNEFELNVGRHQYQEDLNGDPMHGMQLTFCLHEVKPGDWLYPKAQLLIFAASNYVGVYYRTSETREEFGPWQHLSNHDSCWRDDGVDRFLRMFGDRIATLDWHGNLGSHRWYTKRVVTKEFYDQLREITKQARKL